VSVGKARRVTADRGELLPGAVEDFSSGPKRLVAQPHCRVSRGCADIRSVDVRDRMLQIFMQASGQPDAGRLSRLRRPFLSNL
jgi:hypothetical protein